MKQYIAFLRGINISGKNKVSMAELKEGFEKLDFGDVKTYLNSGNVIFSGDEDEDETFTNQIEVMLSLIHISLIFPVVSELVRLVRACGSKQ